MKPKMCVPAASSRAALAVPAMAAGSASAAGSPRTARTAASGSTTAAKTPQGGPARASYVKVFEAPGTRVSQAMEGARENMHAYATEAGATCTEKSMDIYEVGGFYVATLAAECM